MADSIDPAPPAPVDRRGQDRRGGDRRGAREAFKSQLPVVVSPQPPPSPDERKSDSAFVAQLYGQRGQKNGLKGGQPVLDEARSAYREAEWWGAADRRTPAGRITKKDI